MWKKFTNTILVGALAAAPLALTFYIFVSLFQWFDSLFQPLIQNLPGSSGQPIPGLGLLLGILFIFLVGLIAPSLLGRQFLVLTERIVEKLPLAKLVYSGTKQIFDSFSGDQLKKFNRVVLIEFPRKGMYTLGFVTSEYPESLIPNAEVKLAVFVPTTPNPTSGYLEFVNPSEVITVDISVEEALKLIISGGIVRSDRLLAKK